MRRTEILAAAAAAAYRFRKIFGSAVIDRHRDEFTRHHRTLDESMALLLALELLKASEESAQEFDHVFRNSISPFSMKRKEAEADLLWLGHHLLDREISTLHDSAQKDAFMDFLMKQLCLITTFGLPDEKAWELGQEWIVRASATQEDYSRFQTIYPEDNRPVVRTLLWEFTKNISINYRGDYRHRSTLDVFGIVLTYSTTVRTLLFDAV